jgi:hypothetical protein
MATEEGIRSLFNGVTPGMLRQCVFIGVGNGLYVPMRNAMVYHSASEEELALG